MTEKVYMDLNEFPTFQPTDIEVYASSMGRKRRWETMFKEMGRAITAFPRPSDRKKGAKHDYNMQTYGEIYKKVEIVYRGINTTADHVLQSGYRIVGGTKANATALREWMEYIGLHTILYDLVRHLLIWGNSFIEWVEDKNGDWGVVELKLLHPHTMYVYASETGDVIGYIQHPDSRRWIDDPTNLPDRMRTSGRKQRGWKKEVKDTHKDAIVFDANAIIHRKWSSMPNSYYGTSTIEPMKRTLTTYVGMMQDISALVRRYGHPMVVWKIGTPEMPGSSEMMRDFEAAMRVRNIGDDPIVPGIVEWDVVGPGQKAMDLEPYVRSLRNDMFAGIAVPEVVLGGTTTGSQAGAEIALEAFSRKVSLIQSMLEDFCRKDLFPKVLGISDGIDPISRSDWRKIPSLVFNPPETTEQKYLRVSTLINSNIVTLEEGREMVGLMPDMPDGERAIDLQKQLSKMSAQQQTTRTPGDTGPPKTTDRDRDKTAAQKPKGLAPPEHESVEEESEKE